MKRPIYSIGHGARTPEALIEALASRGVTYLLDVRSVPIARYHEHFSQQPLQEMMGAVGIKYVFLGDALGGKPKDPALIKDGRADYEAIRASTTFQRGIARVKQAWSMGLGVCMFCGEGRPHGCHRSRLIGRALTDEGIEVHHILPDNAEILQSRLDEATQAHQLGLF